MENESTDGENRRPTDSSWSVENQLAVRAAGEAFLAARGSNRDVPTPAEARDYLEALSATRPLRTAQAEFGFLQMAAAAIWGPAETTFFARVLREHRVSAKPPLKTQWQRVEGEIARLPIAWQVPLMDVANVSATAGAHPKGLILSPSRLQAIATALSRWADYCDSQGLDLCPSGRALKRYAEDLHSAGTVTKKSLGSYLERIASGYFGIVNAAPIPPGVNFVIAEYRDVREGPVTKTASQLVGARRIYALGQKHFAQAKQRAFIGTEAAIQARDGILLMLAVAVGQRAEALAALAFGRTLILGPRPQIIVDLPGFALKTRQRFKAVSRQREEFGNPELWDALNVYRTHFRPIFDGGDAVFPSKIALGRPLSSRRLSDIMGALTEAHFGVRITLHRVRDNVATEAVEEMAAGLSVAAGVLRHKDHRTTETHYIRQQGRVAMAQLAQLTDVARGKRTRLKV